jgi:hypothetical protein
MPYDLSACGLVTVSQFLVQDDSVTGKGIILRNGDLPMITRGWDCFTSGPRSGIGRWGLFMEAGETYLAAPGTDYGGARIGLGGFLADGTKQNVLTITTCTKRVGIGTMCPSHPLHIYDGGNSVYTRWERSTGDMYVGSDSIGGAIGVIGNIPLYFYTVDGTERMRLTQCGNLGIGITDPIARLHVEQSTSGEVGRFRANVAGCADLVLVNNAQTWGFRVDNAASNALHIRNFQNTTNIMTLATGGNVGIGTTTPAYKLQVVNSGAVGVSIVTAGSDSGNPSLQLLSGATDSTISSTSNGLELTAYSAHALLLRTANVERMRVTSGGNVGIGTTSPNAPLHVQGPSADGTATFRITSTSAPSSFNYAGTLINGCLCSNRNYIFMIGQDLSNRNSGYIGYNHTGTTNSNNNFLTFGHFQSDNLLNLLGNGNVGVGTTCPGTNLEVNGVDAEIMVHYASNSRGGFRALDTQRLGILTTDCSDSLVFGFENGHKGTFTERMRICNVSGNVGINTSTPGTYKLNVNGAFYAAGSSCEYKTSICNYNTDSCMFMKLKPVTYQYKDEWCHLGKELKSGTQIGLIAEDTAEVFPELAILKEEDEQKIVRNVDYEKLSIVLLAEVQKLRHEMDQLKQN